MRVEMATKHETPQEHDELPAELPQTTLERLKIADIVLDERTQARAAWDPDLVIEYREAIRMNDLPPPFVFWDKVAKKYFLADGHYRLAAIASMGVTTCHCQVRKGTLRDAIIFACGANREHGLRRTNSDKERAILILLGDDAWRLKSSRWIAETCGVSKELVQKVKQKHGIKDTIVMGADGKQYPSSKIKLPPAAAPKAKPEVPEIEYDSEEEFTAPHLAKATVQETVPAQTVPAQTVPKAACPKAAAMSPADKALAARHDFDLARTAIHAVRKQINAVKVMAGGKYIDMGKVDTAIQMLHDQLTNARPEAECVDCAGLDCMTCGGDGWLRKA